MRTTMFVLLAVTAAACADEMPRDVQEATAPVDSTLLLGDTTGNEPEPSPGALPPGGHADWIADMRQELPRIIEESRTDRSEALDALRQLYLTRQQPLRDHFGAGGSAFASDELAQAITTADEHFQELMRQLASEEAPDERLQEAATSLDQTLVEVEAAAVAAGLPPNAPRG